MGNLRFYIGWHRPAHAWRFDLVCMSINRLRGRRIPMMVGFGDGFLMLDSGAFTEINTHGGYRHTPAAYAKEVNELARHVPIEIAVAQDYMCEPFVLALTGLTVAEHQHLTIERYDALLAAGVSVPVMPVLQGYAPNEYVDHIHAYGDRLTLGAWVGVGSVCKRNGNPVAVLAVLDAIHAVRPDLRLHGFGLKKTALRTPAVLRLLYSADSMAWSYAARVTGGDANGWVEAQNYKREIDNMTGGALWAA